MSKASSLVVDINGKDSNVSSPEREEIESSQSFKRESNIRPHWTHNPILLSALTCSNMHDCDEVKEIYSECLAKGSDSMMCEAAAKYYQMCHEKGSTLSHHD